MPFFAGEQELGLEEREPGRHHQIVGRQLQPGFQRLVDEGEILLGQREHGDLGEVHLLRAGQRQQQVQRTLEAFQIDDQRFAGARGVVGVAPALERGPRTKFGARIGSSRLFGLLIRCDHDADALGLNGG